MKRKLALMLVVSLILSLGAFSTVSFAEEDDTYDFLITTGKEFVKYVVETNFEKTFKIEGKETLNDGSKGIVLTADDLNYDSITGFKGTLEGVDGKNNIQINTPLFATFAGQTTISNINLKADSTKTFATPNANGQGALVCYINTKGTYNISDVKNYVDISSDKTYTGGILGQVKKGAWTITNCSNYGSVESTAATGHVGGIVGGFSNASVSSFSVEKSFNAGNVTGGRYAAGIVEYDSAATGTISNCFNVGIIKTTYTEAKNGISGIARNSKAKVTNCYNVGLLSNANSNCDLYAITDSTTEGCANNYYVNTNSKLKVDDAVSTEKTIDELAKELPTGFDKNVWEYVETSETNKYSLPQIKGNTFVTTADTWYVAPVQAPSFTVTPESFYTTEDFDEADKYAIVVTKFDPANADGYTYGMYLYDADGNELAKVPAEKNVSGAFGILFYGNKFVSGNTYCVKPYLEKGVDVIYGAETSFTFPRDAE